MTTSDDSGRADGLTLLARELTAPVSDAERAPVEKVHREPDANEHDARMKQALRQLARPRKIGEPLTKADHHAAQLVLAAYWPRYRSPRPLPEGWQ